MKKVLSIIALAAITLGTVSAGTPVARQDTGKVKVKSKGTKTKVKEKTPTMKVKKKIKDTTKMHS